MGRKESGMLTTTLGNTGLKVSRMGLGGGGHSRLGLRSGATNEQAARIVREALNLGVNFFDTAESYGTEEAVGIGLHGVPRETVVVSTKIGASRDDVPISPEELREALEGCLKRLRMEYVDILHLHGVTPGEYPHARDVLYPALVELREAGKIRHVGITEAFIRDPRHEMLAVAVPNDPWEVVMVGFSLLNPSARSLVLPHTMRRGIGTLCMFAVRRALSNPDALASLLESLLEAGYEDVQDADRLRFLTAPGVARSLQEAAYRFCLWEPGIDVVLSGTGNVEHLRENAQSLEGPRLPEEVLSRLDRIFGRVDSVSGN